MRVSIGAHEKRHSIKVVSGNKNVLFYQVLRDSQCRANEMETVELIVCWMSCVCVLNSSRQSYSVNITHSYTRTAPQSTRPFSFLGKNFSFFEKS